MGISMGEMKTTQELANTFFEMVLHSGNVILWVSHSLTTPDLGVFPSSRNNGDCLGDIFCNLLLIR
jgi:hypothetical protein